MATEELRNYIKDNIKVGLSLDSRVSFMKRNLQHFISLRPQDVNIKSQYEIALTHAVNAESTCPGSGLLFLQLLCGEHVHDVESVNDIDSVKKLFYSMKFQKHVFNILEYVLSIADVNSNIVLKKVHGQHHYVEVLDGYSFDAISPLVNSPVRLNHSMVACIDGYVESISEVHHLFSEIAENKTPCLLFLRGISDEVLHTIKVNNDRKTMVVFPYVMPFDVDHANTLVDIAIVSNTDVVSSTKGELISSLRYSKLGNAHNCMLSSDNAKLNNTLTKQKAKFQIHQLRQKILEREELSSILSKRIKSLSSSCIEIGIPDDINFYSTQQQLDEGIRILTSILNNKYAPAECARRYLNAFNETFNREKLHLLLDN